MVPTWKYPHSEVFIWVILLDSDNMTDQLVKMHQKWPIYAWWARPSLEIGRDHFTSKVRQVNYYYKTLMC